MNPIFEETTAQLASILDMFDVSYDDTEEKYIAKSYENVVIDPEKIEWIIVLDLMFYSIVKTDDSLTVKFIHRKGGIF